MSIIIYRIQSRPLQTAKYVHLKRFYSYIPKQLKCYDLLPVDLDSNWSNIDAAGKRSSVGFYCIIIMIKRDRCVFRMELITAENYCFLCFCLFLGSSASMLIDSKEALPICLFCSKHICFRVLRFCTMWEVLLSLSFGFSSYK